LFETHNKTVNSDCSANTTALPAYLIGDFLIPSLGQFEMGDQKIKGLFDAFGKMHRFRIYPNGTLCFTCRMMDTEFYNSSVKLGSVAAGDLFYKTDPPRPYTGMENIKGPNDNVFVNTYRIVDPHTNTTRYRAITDSQTGLEFDIDSLQMVRNITWTDNLDKPGPPIIFMSGSAHPHHEKTRDGCFYNVLPTQMMLPIGGLFPKVTLFQVCPEHPTMRTEINSYRPKYMPYFHSWGITENFALFPHMPFTIDVLPMMMGGTIVDSFKLTKSDGTTTLMVMPLNGSASVEFKVPGDFFYSHSINSYETNGTIVYDLIMFKQNPFIQAADLSFYTNRTTRDSMPAGLRGVATRLVLHMEGASQGQVDITTLSAPGTSTDFPTTNDGFAKSKYCIYFAVEWFHGGSESYASKAIVKQNVCTGERKYWHKPSHYPSEARFIDDDKSDIEDDGTVVFTVLDGTTGISTFMMLDSRTMEELDSYKLNVPIAFTTHGQFFPTLPFAPTQ